MNRFKKPFRKWVPLLKPQQDRGCFIIAGTSVNVRGPNYKTLATLKTPLKLEAVFPSRPVGRVDR